jgi:hypothetical protein
MPCYDYTNPVSSLFTNTEVTLPVSGTVYSFNSLYWICNFSLTTQLKVFKKNSGTNATVELILNTDFTIDELNNEITTLTSLTGYNQIIIQRATLSDQMITRFVEGAKLTAKDLNDCFHQLLFVTQEKDYTNSTVNINYSLATSVAAWTNGTNYVVGDIVSYNNKIYKCILATNSIVPTNTANWVLINPTLNGFYLTGTNSSIEFDLSNLTVGKALIWNGTKFVGSLFSGALNSLSDIDVDPVQNKDILVYDTSNSNKWTAKSPTVDITENNLKFFDRTFYPSNSSSWFNPIGSALNVSAGSVATALQGFKDNSNRWVVTDAPTVYHIVKKILPNETDPITFFNDVKTDLDAAVQNLTNPVKLKLYWNLNMYRENRTAVSTPLNYLVNSDVTLQDNLGNFKSMFWNKPEELYNLAGYDINAVNPLLKHGITDGTNQYYTSPYFVYNSTNIATTYKSKLEGYGIKAFYLSVPECRTNHIYLPVLSQVGQSWAFTQLSNVANSEALLTKALQAPGNEYNTLDGSVTTSTGVKDYYLMGIRDMVCAGARFRDNTGNTTANTTFPGNSTQVKVLNNISRWQKARVIGAYYGVRSTNSSSSSAWKNILYKRFEYTNDAAADVLWKIPDQIIYFNRYCLAQSIAPSASYTVSETSDVDDALKRIRFQGFHRLQTNSNAHSSTTSQWDGLYYKSNGFWQAFQDRWSDETGQTFNYKFNEADIEWALYDVDGPDVSATPGIYRLNSQPIPFSAFSGTWTPADTRSNRWYPWGFRSNNVFNGEDGSSNLDNIRAIGVHGIHETDQAKLFSEADQFIEDPCDEYVYRIVSKPSVVNYLTQNGFKDLKSSIILEHGFSDLAHSTGTATPLTSLNSQYESPRLEPSSKRAFSRLFESKIKIFIKDEKIERVTIGQTNVDYYVITLVIKVPRLKSIGFSRLFRHYYTDSVNAPNAWNGADDTDPELGIWTYSNPLFTNSLEINGSVVAGSGNLGFGHNGTFPIFRTIPSANTSVNLNSFSLSNTTYYRLGTTGAGRIEAAVKFTSIGLPSNLWIRLSVLNTDGTTALLDGTSSNFGFTSSTFAN